MQYVGARYVPKFMGLYDNTQAYEGLCVVDNGMGTSYITKKPTPAGTPLTDTDYYAVYGASSGAIINLQNQIGDLNDLNTTDKDSLVDAINEVDGDIQTLAKKVGGSILVIGNSYVLYGCADKLKNTFTNSYQKTGGGYGFVAYSGHSSTFVDLLNDAIIDSDIPNDDITDIIFISAVGDGRALTAQGESDYVTALNSALTQINTLISTNFTNCKRVSLSYAETRKVASFADSTYTALFALHRIFKKSCYEIGIDYLGWSGFNSLFVSAEIDSDNYHPTPIGASRIGQFIHDSYYGHCEYITKKSEGNSGFAIQNDALCTIKAYLTPDRVSMNIRYAHLTAGAISLGAGALFITTSGLSIPLPKPSSDIDFIGEIKDLTDYSKVCDIITTLTGNANGIAVFLNSNAISGTIASNANVLLNVLTDICYTV